MCHGSPDRPSALTGDNQTVGDQGYADKLNQWAAKVKTGVIGDISEASERSFFERLGDGLPGSFMSSIEREALNHMGAVHLYADFMSMIPVIGEYFDLINGIGYAAEGDWLNAGLSFAAMVPIAGWVPGALKIGIKGGRAAKVAANSGDDLTRVGRWMSENEFAQMSKTGRVIEGGGGRTYVTRPANPDAYPAGKGVYAEFDVPTSSVHQAGKPEWGVIPGPNVTTKLYGPSPPEMPPATCIVRVCNR